MSKYPSRDEILSELAYSSSDGTFTRKPDGARSGTSGNGYLYDRVGGQLYPRGVLVWIVEHGEPPKGRIRFLDRRTNTHIDMLRDLGARLPHDRLILKERPDGSGLLDFFISEGASKENAGFMWRATLQKEGVKGLVNMTDLEVYELARRRQVLS